MHCSLRCLHMYAMCGVLHREESAGKRHRQLSMWKCPSSNVPRFCPWYAGAFNAARNVFLHLLVFPFPPVIIK